MSEHLGAAGACPLSPAGGAHAPLVVPRASCRNKDPERRGVGRGARLPGNPGGATLPRGRPQAEGHERGGRRERAGPPRAAEASSRARRQTRPLFPRRLRPGRAVQGPPTGAGPVGRLLRGAAFVARTGLALSGLPARRPVEPRCDPGGSRGPAASRPDGGMERNLPDGAATPSVVTLRHARGPCRPDRAAPERAGRLWGGG